MFYMFYTHNNKLWKNWDKFTKQEKDKKIKIKIPKLKYFKETK